MKIIKISLVIAVISLIAFFVVNSLVPSQNPPPPPPPKNQFTEMIEKQINDISKLPVNKFCKNKYDEVKFYIEDFYNKKRLGNNQPENNQWKERLSKNLYSVYADKFVKQTYNVFNNSAWNPKDLEFIKSECQLLRASQFLQRGNLVDNSFSRIQRILSKYDEINNFIASCKRFSYSDDSLTSTYPISNANLKIARVTSYKNNNLENSFVNNCVRLHSQLNETTKFLFNAHIRYLDKKIEKWSGMYSEYNSHGEYASELYFKIKSEINGLDNDNYHVFTFDSEYNRLIDKLNLDNSNAKAFFSK